MERGRIFFGTFEKNICRKFAKFKKVNYICTTMLNDLEKTITHGRLTSVVYRFHYSQFTDVVSIEATWNSLNETQKVSIPAEKLGELITFLEDARVMFNLGQRKDFDNE